MIRVINNIHFGWDTATGYPINQYIFAISDASELPQSPWTDPRDGSMHIIKGGSRSWDIGSAAMYGYKDSTWTRQFTMNGGGAPLHGTITGVPPISFIGNGSPLISWSMLGNGSQTGTPTPDVPIMPTFCGVRTAQLFDYQTMAAGEIGAYLKNDGTTQGEDSWAISDYIPCNGQTFTLSKVGGNAPSICFYDAEKQFISGQAYNTGGSNRKANIAATAISTASYIRFSYMTKNFPDDLSTIMLNSGPTALPHEPYGYKIPITNAGQTVPVYLGQVQTVRRIKKLVLTGEETSWKTSNGFMFIDVIQPDYLRSNAITLICSHYAAIGGVGSGIEVSNGQCALYRFADVQRLYIRDTNYTTVADFKSCLAAQYANGTPVTVWYVLNTPETAIVNEPLAKIGDYADELHSEDAGVTIPTARGQNTLTVDTPIQPSSMTIEY